MELSHNLDRLCRSTTEPSVNLTHYLNTINIILKSHSISISKWLVINEHIIINFVLIIFFIKHCLIIFVSNIIKKNKLNWVLILKIYLYNYV